MPSISVVIPCRNEAEFIESALGALQAQDLRPDEIIVVDNASTDGSGSVVERYATRHPELKLTLQRCSDEGAAAPLNAGIRAARGDIILRMDGHSRPHADYIRRCVERLQDPGAGVVGGVWEVTPSRPTAPARAIALAVSSRLGSGGATYRDRDTNPTPRDVDTVPFGAFRRSLWTELGGYDESLQVVEDGDFNYRVRQAGYRVILDPATRCTYFSRASFGALGRQYFRYGWWKMWMLRKHPGATRIRQLIPLGFVTTVLALALGGAFSTVTTTVLAGLFVVYGAALLAEGLRVSRRARDIRLGLPIAAAYAVVHFAWGLGGLTHIVTAGRWPPWRSRSIADPS